MASKTNFRLPALVCALVLPLCAVLVQPAVETGIVDEGSYIRSAQILAQTGHVVYNGWATAMIGWQLLWGALFFKLFGFSFLVARLSVLVLAMMTIFLIQRCMVRTGINEWNATLGTLAIVLTPIMLPLSLSFMTDVPGMLAIVICFYACIRALQAKTDHSQMGWLCFAALENAVGGTARQIAWLGVLVMVPCTVWLLRRKRRVALIGGLSYLAGACMVFAAMQWFKHQPYSVAARLHRSPINKRLLFHLPANLLRPTLETALFILPILLMFLPAIWRSRQRAVSTLVGCAALGLLAGGMVHLHHAGRGLLAPFLLLHGNYVSPFGLLLRWPMHCHYPVVLHENVRLMLSIATIVSLMAILAVIVGRERVRDFVPSSHKPLSWWKICVLIVPFTVAYGVLLLPYGIGGFTVDKYLLPLLPFLLILLLRLYQERMARRLPWLALALLIFMGAYSVAVTHDLFATYRGALAAMDEMRAAGIPRTQIDGGWEYNAWTELEQGGYLHQQGARIPGNLPWTVGKTENVCPIDDLFLTPDVFPQYSLSFDSTACEGLAAFAPVSYHRWLGPHTATVYIVKNPTGVGLVHRNTGGRGGPGDLCWGHDAIDADLLKRGPGI